MESSFKIEAVIRPQRLDAVQEAMNVIGVHGLTVTEVRGVGRQKGVTHTFRGSQYMQNLSPRIKVEVVVTGEQLEEAAAALQQAAATGEVGDGKIFIAELKEVIRIRTGEKGNAALS